MPAVYRHHLTAQDEEIDGQRHVNNLHYLRWMQDAAIAHSSAQGWTPERYLQVSAGWVVRTHFIEYQKPTYAGDEITVITWVANFKRIQSLRKYNIVRQIDDAVLAIAETNWAFVGLEDQVPKRIPPELADAFEVVSIDPEP